MKWYEFKEAVDEELNRLGCNRDVEIEWIDSHMPYRKEDLQITCSEDRKTITITNY